MSLESFWLQYTVEHLIYFKLSDTKQAEVGGKPYRITDKKSRTGFRQSRHFQGFLHSRPTVSIFVVELNILISVFTHFGIKGSCECRTQRKIIWRNDTTLQLETISQDSGSV